MTILVSACLMGVNCKYSGICPEPVIPKELSEKHTLIPICPEIMGGLDTPREPSEIRDGRVLSRDGRDVTEYFVRGAWEALRLVELYECEYAILKERSPSCGYGRVYDGTFSGTLKDGNGICAGMLARKGVKILGESEIYKLL